MSSQPRWFHRLPKELQLRFSLDLAKAKAELGRDSFFDRWWFLDTNCVSELVKLHREGDSSAHQFIAGRDVLLLSTVLQELRKAPSLHGFLEDALQCANVFLLADLTRFWWTDICNFLNVDRLPVNSLDVRPLPVGMLQQLGDREDFDRACSQSEEAVRRDFFSRVAPDIAADLDERDLGVTVWSRVNKYGKEWFDIDIPHSDATPRNFPSFYVFHYAYYFRFVKNKATPELNDFIDLSNCMAAPYCERFYTEARFAHILRHHVQGREPPSIRELIKRTYKKGLIGHQTYKDAKRKNGGLGRRYKLLPSTGIFSLSEMLDQIHGSH